MKKYFIYNIAFFALVAVILSSCYSGQDVAPIDSPDDNPIVTIEPGSDYAGKSFKEGDVLTFDVSVDQPLRYDLTFGVTLEDASVVGSSDFEVLNAVLPAYSTSTTVSVVIIGDAAIESTEAFVFEFSAGVDLAFNWQLNPSSDAENLTINILSYDYELDWTGMLNDEGDVCDWEVDLDIYVANADFSVADFSGATGACPMEHGTLVDFPDGTYDIYVDFWAISADLPADSDLAIPYVAKFDNNNGDAYEITGTYSSDDEGDSRVVGQIEISAGVYTLYDENGVEIGVM